MSGNPVRSAGRTTPVHVPSDDALLAGVATGDEDAMRAFVRRFQQRVYGVAVAVLSDRSAAQDIAQEAFLRAWKRADAYDSRRGSVSTWLLAITRNAAIDAARLRRAQPVDPELLVVLEVADADRAPDDVAVDHTELDRVRRALAAVPPEQREALILASVFGRSAAEIARHTGVPLGTAKTRIRSALRRVRTDLDEGRVTP